VSASPLEDPSTCRACRGTGTVISSRGDAPHPVTCPWCEGSGSFIPGHDAQAAAREGRAPDA
jgi:DnaJ-class molecular chaperone